MHLLCQSGSGNGIRISSAILKIHTRVDSGSLAISFLVQSAESLSAFEWTFPVFSGRRMSLKNKFATTHH
jgi:hypothetical protein